MEFISRSDVLKLFNISVWTLRRWQKNNNFPSPIPASSKVIMYRKPAVEAWLEVQAKKSEPYNPKAIRLKLTATKGNKNVTSI